MTPTQKTLFVGGLLCLGLGLPQNSYAITGCGNNYLTGTYNAQISSVNFQKLLNALNSGTSGSTGTTGERREATGTTGSGATGSTGSTGPRIHDTTQGGFGNNPASLGGKRRRFGTLLFRRKRQHYRTDAVFGHQPEYSGGHIHRELRLHGDHVPEDGRDLQRGGGQQRCDRSCSSRATPPAPVWSAAWNARPTPASAIRISRRASLSASWASQKRDSHHW